MEKEKEVTIIVRIFPKSLRTALKVRAAETGVSMQQITTDAVAKYLGFGQCPTPGSEVKT